MPPLTDGRAGVARETRLAQLHRSRVRTLEALRWANGEYYQQLQLDLAYFDRQLALAYSDRQLAGDNTGVGPAR